MTAVSAEQSAAVEKATGIGGAVMLEHLADGLGESGIIGADRLRKMAQTIRDSIDVQLVAQVHEMQLLEAGFKAAPVDEEKIRADERQKVADYLEGIRWESGNGSSRRPSGFRSAAGMVRRIAPPAHTHTHECCVPCSNTATSNWYRDNPRDEGVARD